MHLLIGSCFKLFPVVIAIVGFSLQKIKTNKQTTKQQM